MPVEERAGGYGMDIEKGLNAGTFLFGVRGRLNRAGYWIFLLVAFYWLFVGLFTMLGRNLPSTPSLPLTLPPWMTDPTSAIIALLLFAVPLVAAAFCITIRRLHDLNRSGLWSMLYILAPPVLAYAAGRMDLAYWTDSFAQENFPPVYYVPLLMNFLSLVIQTWALVELGCIKGTPGDNLYGPDPLQRAEQRTPSPSSTHADRVA